ncbi:MAG: phosphoenolpyruvate--protein phosphotransferase [Legionellales bacterium]|nr:phosphoenolpyruvate--protein phosphotransferase [Legionellales bacterium]|tara:strand:- start:27152 stop:29431 length:2280 start_codon:yes stop_codon:yes gene_type:complete
MLTTLKRIVQEVSTASDIEAVLNIVVARVKEAMETDACSIFIYDPNSDEFMLMAAEGIDLKTFDDVRVGFTEGLVGFVAERAEPLNLEDVREHPSFLPHPTVAEENFHAYLGVPIVHHRQLLGVMTVQQAQKRRYDEAEEAFLVTLCAQLAGVIAHAEATGRINELIKPKNNRVTNTDVATMGGIPSGPGVGIGHAVVVFPKADLTAVPDRQTDNVDAEKALFERAVLAARKDIKTLAKRFSENLAKEEYALFDMYLTILSNASLGKEVIEEIEKGNWAQGALRIVIDNHVQQFAAMDDEYLRERVTDIRDIGRRVLAHLQDLESPQQQFADDVILVGEEITAADLAEVPEGKLLGVVSAKGSNNSHVAILARALGVPTVMAATGIPMQKLEGQQLIVDGYYGHVYVAPSKKLLKEFQSLAAEERELDADLQQLRDLPAETQDGYQVDLYVNTGLAADSGVSLSVGASGVGLYRSEVAFMSRESFPTEEDQRVIYRQLLKAFAPRPVTMRTLDIGGDKALPYFPVEEDNPYLGWRGIRVTLDHPEVFLMQIRAMLRANEGLNNLRIMLPMVTMVSEVDEAVGLIERAYVELVEEGAEIELPPVGMMIEVPSAVYQAREFAKRVDFFSVGSNDLTQYLLAVDRNNSRVSDLYDALHPAVLRALQYVVETAKQEAIPVSLCGEIASDPLAIPILLGMGFDGLSMTASSLPRMKWIVRNFSLDEAKALTNEVLLMDNPTMIRFRLERALEKAGLGGLIRAGK